MAASTRGTQADTEPEFPDSDDSALTDVDTDVEVVGEFTVAGEDAENPSARRRARRGSSRRRTRP
jgi:hypothetical protein